MGTTFSAEQCSEKWRAHKKSIKDANASEAGQIFRTGNLSMPRDAKMSETEAWTYSLLRPQINSISYSKTTFTKSFEEAELLSPPSKKPNLITPPAPDRITEKKTWVTWNSNQCSKRRSCIEKKSARIADRREGAELAIFTEYSRAKFLVF